MTQAMMAASIPDIRVERIHIVSIDGSIIICIGVGGVGACRKR
jgi:hypothetical protein